MNQAEEKIINKIQEIDELLAIATNEGASEEEINILLDLRNVATVILEKVRNKQK